MKESYPLENNWDRLGKELHRIVFLSLGRFKIDYNSQNSSASKENDKL